MGNLFVGVDFNQASLTTTDCALKHKLVIDLYVTSNQIVWGVHGIPFPNGVGLLHVIIQVLLYYFCYSPDDDDLFL